MVVILQIMLDDVKCQGNEETLDSCSHAPYRKHNCFTTQNVYLSCGMTCFVMFIISTIYSMLYISIFTERVMHFSANER